jgi:hypothetical protein
VIINLVDCQVWLSKISTANIKLCLFQIATLYIILDGVTSNTL